MPLANGGGNGFLYAVWYVNLVARKQDIPVHAELTERLVLGMPPNCIRQEAITMSDTVDTFSLFDYVSCAHFGPFFLARLRWPQTSGAPATPAMGAHASWSSPGNEISQTPAGRLSTRTIPWSSRLPASSFPPGSLNS